MSLLATIEALHRELDEHPDAHDTRLILADALEEAGGEWAALAPGYRALGLLRLEAVFHKDHGVRHQRQGFKYWRSSAHTPHAELPPDWMDEWADIADALGYGPGPRIFPARRDAEDAAALAFAKLPAGRRAELLAPP